jgi:hypothetical protein
VLWALARLCPSYAAPPLLSLPTAAPQTLFLHEPASAAQHSAQKQQQEHMDRLVGAVVWRLVEVAVENPEVCVCKR